jgi:endoglucanase
MRFYKMYSILLVIILFTGCTLNPESVVTGVEQVSDETVTTEVEEKTEGGREVMDTEDVTKGDGAVIVPLRAAIHAEGFIQARGKNLYTNYGEGDLINLRGVNVGGYLLQEFWMTPTQPSADIKAELDIVNYLSRNFGESMMRELIEVYQANYFTQADFNNCQAMGMNSIRLPFWYRNIVDADGKVYEDWFDRFDWFISEAGQRGIYVILDFHGAPGSQNGSDHSGVEGGEDKEGASRFFYGDELEVRKNQELYYQIWELLATRYKDNPVVAGYGLLNEPYCTYRYSSKKSVKELHTTLWRVYDEAYRRIRAIDPNHLIIMGATWDPLDLPNPDDYGWENIMYEYHNYLYDDYNNAKNGQLNNMRKKVNLIKRANYNVPSYMGEFNYFDNLEAWDKGLALLTDAGLSWSIWTYKTVPHYKNWGLYHHTLANMSIQNASPEAIRAHWEKVGKSKANEALIRVVMPYLVHDMVAGD